MITFGRGIVKKDDEGVWEYVGSIPDYNDCEQVVIMRKSDLELMINTGVELLLSTGMDMDETMVSQFPDQVRFTYSDTTSQKLFLDRRGYSLNLKDMVFFRYVSVDQSIMEEGPTPPNGGPHENENGTIG